MYIIFNDNFKFQCEYAIIELIDKLMLKCEIFANIDYKIEFEIIRI